MVGVGISISRQWYIFDGTQLIQVMCLSVIVYAQNDWGLNP